MVNTDWSDKEVELIISDYFGMLQQELNDIKYNKSFHRKRLVSLLNNRSEGSIEFKHQNISAILINLGLPFIKGYKPMSNYQFKLERHLVNYLDNNKLGLEKDFETFSSLKIQTPIKEINLETLLINEPISSHLQDREPSYKPIKINYLRKEQENRILGEQGEKLVIEYERYRLLKAGKNNLADQIEWISKDKGDGTGYDILSRNLNGTDRYLEVKTTKLTKETPIFVTKTEVSFAQHKSKDFYLYRLFNFDSTPGLFIKNGHYTDFCNLQPQNYKGYFTS